MNQSIALPKYQIGDLIYYFRGWTARYTSTATVVRIEVDPVDHTVFYTLSDGHWCYEGQIRDSLKYRGLAK